MGHAAGDALLQAISRSLANGLRSSDLVARWGGEEFIVLVASSDLEKLRGLGERCRQLVANTLCTVGNQIIEVTASVGGDAIQPADDLLTLMERVDARLYESKRRGRNRVTIDYSAGQSTNS